MAKSAEYKDLPWVTPRSWDDANRSSVQLLVIHTTEGAANAQAAENGAAYDARREDGTSCHFFIDSDSIVQCVRTADVAYSALWNGNQRGIHFELCGTASWSTAQWQGAYQQAMLKRAAALVARVAHDWAIPPQKITATQAAAGVEGICGHGDITKAFPADGGDHTDPGPNFPWSQFMTLVKQAQSPKEWDEMATQAQLVDAARDGVRELLWDAVHAQREDAAYKAATDVRKGEMRNARDLLEEILKGAVREVLQEGTETPPATS